MELELRRAPACFVRSTTRSGARPRTTRCACCARCRRRRSSSAAATPRFLEIYDRAIAHLDSARSATNTWWNRTFPDLTPQSIAYFSAEFALHQSLPIYAGGLGVLAGDHCKEASDLGVPLIGIGFMYPQGYFHQQSVGRRLAGGDLREAELGGCPDRAGDDADGSPCIVPVPLGDRSVLVAVWRVQLGRAKLYPARHGSRGERAVGPAALRAPLRRRPRDARPAGDHPRASAASASCARWACTRRSITSTKATPASSSSSASASSSTRGASFDAALDEVRRTTVFTTHTPVPAGHDAFPFHLVETAPGRRLGHARRAPRRDSSPWAHYDNGGGSQFNMTALALRSSGAVNAVSQLHGEVTRSMWAPIWPGIAADRVAAWPR